ncbi:RHS repeat-associated protein [Chryseobacterium vietnamense]|uniref:hypothetical protein n=1 Tax=Chryseobacterium vietnamense TaxID=866785 RepID=UPI00285B9FC5|nr:hypothetical protein [Chryseobacterium vietnamense]MDR6489150.1 RHS repeat-associated protein [Chryseobacterium vietnamense]
MLESIDTNNYYPFGLNHIGGSSYSNFGSYYKYNGKELQETGMYDYIARMYMSDIGCWVVVDSLAEKNRRFLLITMLLIILFVLSIWMVDQNRIGSGKTGNGSMIPMLPRLNKHKNYGVKTIK